MNKKFIFNLIFLLFISTTVSAQSIKYEQIAFEYYFQNILVKELPDLNKLKIQFSGSVEKKSTYLESYVPPCFVNDFDLNQKLYQPPKKVEVINKSISTENISKSIDFSKKKVRSKQKLMIYSVTEYNELFYVKIEIAQENSGITVYLIEMDINGKILRWCFSDVAT